MRCAAPLPRHYQWAPPRPDLAHREPYQGTRGQWHLGGASKSGGCWAFSWRARQPSKIRPCSSDRKWCDGVSVPAISFLARSFYVFRPVEWSIETMEAGIKVVFSPPENRWSSLSAWSNVYVLLPCWRCLFENARDRHWSGMVLVQQADIDVRVAIPSWRHCLGALHPLLARMSLD